MIFAQNPSLAEINAALDDAFASVVLRPIHLDQLRRIMTEEERETARALAADGRTGKQIARALGVSLGVAFAATSGIRRKAKRDEQIAEMWRAGMNRTEIAIALKADPRTVSSAVCMMRKRGIDLPRRRA